MKSQKMIILMMHNLFCFMAIFSKQDTITITANQSIQYHETLVSTTGIFEAGFFEFGNSRRQYFGIWYKSILPKTIVWVANRNAPVQNSTAVLKLTDQGNLVLDDTRGMVWSSNSSSIAAKPVLQLLDSGNLVVKDGSTDILLWQSFDYPGDTFLAGMKLKSNLVTGPYQYLTSWRDSEDPAEGEFSYHIDSRGFPQVVTTKGEKNLYSSGPWNGYLFSGVSWKRMHTILNFSLELTDKEVSYEYETFNSSILTITRLNLSPKGNSDRYLWSEQKQSWDIVATHPVQQCEYYAFCGVNSNCDINAFPICQCLQGFRPKVQANWDLHSWSSGCVKKIKPNCDYRNRFLKYTGMKLPDTSASWFNKSLNLEECKTLCLKNCSCSAYTNLDIRDGGSGCLLWFDDIVDLRNHTDQGQDIYIRLEFSELDQSRNSRNLNRKKLAGILVGLITFVIALTILMLTTSPIRKRIELPKQGSLKRVIRWKHMKENDDDILRTVFDFSTINIATNHFSHRNKLGEGGFGTVYKGILADGQEIAVKRLSKTSRQGNEEFKNEVKLMATLQHRNLIKLLGCSIQQNEKLLIYEFMPNKSLDYFIFDTMRRKLLNWTKRLEIISGIARGLLYLHQDSTLRIIHRDLKTSNILLDNNMNAKISDFGLARTFGGDQAEANTNRVMGTYGYMPPEYAVHGSFSTKSDVFSYGVIVLEIISGRKNRGFHDPHNHLLNLLGHAWRLWIEKRPLELIDAILDDGAGISSKILRCIHVGLLCVQQNPEDRPNMSSVVLMLNGGKLVSKPNQPGFYTGKANTTETGSSSKQDEACSVNEISISLIQPR